MTDRTVVKIIDLGAVLKFAICVGGALGFQYFGQGDKVDVCLILAVICIWR